MRKYLILTSLLTLTGCMGGGSADGLMLLFGNESKPAFAGTPQETLEANSSITKMQTVIDYTTRIKEIYDESGLNYTDDYMDSIAVPEPYVVGIEPEQWRNMSDEDKTKIRAASLAFRKIDRLYHFLDGEPDISSSDLEDAVKMLNAFYKVESDGRIKQKFDMKTVLGMSGDRPALQNFFYDAVGGYDYIYTIANKIYMWDNVIKGSGANIDANGPNGWLSINLDNDGKIVSIEGDSLIRDGDTNRFVNYDGNYTFTLETFGDGKLTYSDFGYATRESNFGDANVSVFAMTTPGAIRNVLKVSDSLARQPEGSMDFKGTAVGLFVNNPDGYADELAHTTKMRTDNATFHLDWNDNSGSVSQQLTMPFSEDGWYDVKFIRDESGRQATFSNYKGNGSNRIPGTFGNVTVTPDVASVDFHREFVWEHQLELPTEMVGTAYADFEPGVYFEAAFGMKAVE